MNDELEERTAKALEMLGTEVEAVKRLLVLLLLKGGASQTELAKALNVGQATVSRLGIGVVTPLEIDVVHAADNSE